MLSLFESLSLLRVRFTALATLLLFSQWVNAGVEVFTVAGEPVTHVPDNAVVIELDATARLDDQLSQGLPQDPQQAQQLIESRMKTPEGQAILKHYERLYTGLARAWMLGVTKVPAVVVDSRYVVYGQPNVAQALDEIRQARSLETTP